jgi:hypothetical protein
MAEVVPIKQELHWASQQSRWVCSKCNNGIHRHCELHDCGCAHRDPVPMPKSKRDKNGLTEEERHDQTNFQFDSFPPLKL